VDAPLEQRWQDEHVRAFVQVVRWNAIAAMSHVVRLNYAVAVQRARIASATKTRVAPTTGGSAPVEPPSSGGSVNGYPCGGSLPPCYVLMRESRGDPLAENPTSSASGLWQFLDSTWAGFGGYARASHAPPSVQNAKAAQLWAGGAGCSHWSAC
jgi:hypothetical protein